MGPNSRATSSDGTSLAVFERGTRPGPTLVAVHGYPDDHTVWDGVAAALADRFRVVCYDVRGAGRSDVPTEREAYRIPHLVDDLVAVVDAVAPDAPVYLLGHDWGSIQIWPALTDARLAGRVAGFVSVSGPSLDHARAWLRRANNHPGAAVRQLARSYYTLLFQIPRLPELAVRAGVVDRAAGPRSRSDQLNGLNLYRANLLRAGARPRPVDVPVQVIAPRDDAYVTPELATQAPAPFVRDLRSRVVAGGHWVVRTQPAMIADCVREFAE